jgi:glutathione S-transferase
VPVLVDTEAGGFTVWDSLAIAEYLHEKFPQAGVWPTDVQARARARSIAAEMHSGFGALRSHCPMNIEADLAAVGAKVWAEEKSVRANVARIEDMWADALAKSGGPYLFGNFSAADAMYAPVCMRMRGYSLPISTSTRAYVDRMVAAPAVAAWMADALAEKDYIVEDEPYRKSR